ncbi:hypothetical protein KFK09_016380 [Dendrobium nobile]|uniref:Uncharacterized protein n=1 Tax=Dendrobium nobile TaxID=94219 RepID=A0A8T3B4K9_DENNO|nr:hypothetical protein KFK09_016380 [Dendrobium nobile]
MSFVSNEAVYTALSSQFSLKESGNRGQKDRIWQAMMLRKTKVTKVERAIIGGQRWSKTSLSGERGQKDCSWSAMKLNWSELRHFDLKFAKVDPKTTLCGSHLTWIRAYRPEKKPI